MELHPWNTDFSWERPERQEYLILNEGQVDQFHEQGFVLLENVLDLDLLAEVTNDLDAIESSRPPKYSCKMLALTREEIKKKFSSPLRNRRYYNKKYYIAKGYPGIVTCLITCLICLFICFICLISRSPTRWSVLRHSG